jgi:hypothetical protein
MLPDRATRVSKAYWTPTASCSSSTTRHWGPCWSDTASWQSPQEVGGHSIKGPNCFPCCMQQQRPRSVTSRHNHLTCKATAIGIQLKLWLHSSALKCGGAVFVQTRSWRSRASCSLLHLEPLSCTCHFLLTLYLGQTRNHLFVRALQPGCNQIA